MTTDALTHIDISSAIVELIQLKSKRDHTKFTAYKLAKAIGVDRSLVKRIINREVLNPRIDTVMKIAQFFLNDGFPININDMVQWDKNLIDIKNQILMDEETRPLPMYLMNNFNGEKIATISATLPKFSPGMVAVIAEKKIEPIFNANSIFIVDMLKHPENENMVLIRVNHSKNLSIRKYLTENHQEAFKPYDSNEPIIYRDTSTPIEIIGVVVKINIKP